MSLCEAPAVKRLSELTVDES